MLKNLFGNKKPKDKFSLENLKYLYGQLVKEPVITNSNKARIVEVLRSIAELLIWGDQHNPSFFDYFMEKNILSNFVRILSQKCDNKVYVQIIQTLSILVQNISNEVSIFYLLSNNYINDMIVHRFDFSDEEIVTLYITFLKSLSFKLNNRTILFFFNEVSQDFPLFNEAIKFFNHSESMIRIAVRTLTLNIFHINDVSLRRYLLNKTSVPYFSHLVWFLRDQTIEYDKMMHAPGATVSKLEVKMEHLLDQLFYIQDVLNCGQSDGESHENDGSASSGGDGGTDGSDNSIGAKKGLYFQQLFSEILIDQLLGFYILPLLVGSLAPAQSKIPAHLLISTRLSFFMLNQIFSIFHHFAFINTVVSVLINENISPLTIKLIQEPPRGPLRNSNGMPLTDLLYPKSAASRKAIVDSELQLLAVQNAPKAKHRNSGSTSLMHTPKPARSNDSISKSSIFDQSPSPSPSDTNESPSPIKSASASLSETELQPIAGRIAVENSPSASSGNEAPSTTENSTTQTSTSRKNSGSAAEVISNTASSIVAAVESSVLDFFASNSSKPSSASNHSHPAPIVADTAPWSCPSCTYENPPTFLACGMCESIRPESSAEAAVIAQVLEAADGAPVPPSPIHSSPEADTTKPASTPSINNSTLASAYLSPASAAAASSPPTSALKTPSATPSVPVAREIPIDENSKARSKLPEVGPLYSPIDYFGFVQPLSPAVTSTSITESAPADIISLSPLAISSIPSPAATAPSATPATVPTLQELALQCVPGYVTDRIELKAAASTPSEPNEYKAAILKYLTIAQAECLASNPLSPLHLAGQVNPVLEEERSLLDERDLYGSMSVLYALMKNERIDSEILIRANICAQRHRKSRKLLAELVSGGMLNSESRSSSSRDILGLASPNMPLSDAALAAANSLNTLRKRSVSSTEALFSSPVSQGKRGSFSNFPAGDKNPLAEVREGDSSLDLLSGPPAPVSMDSPKRNGGSSIIDLMSDPQNASSSASSDEVFNVVVRKPSTVDASAAPSEEKMDDGAPQTAELSLDVLMPENLTRSRGESSDPLLQKSTQKLSSKPPSTFSSPTAAKLTLRSSSSSASTSNAVLFGDEIDGGRSRSIADLGENGLGEDSKLSKPEYNHSLVSELINLFAHHPPYRMVTLQTMLELLKELVYVPEPTSGGSYQNVSCLLPEHLEQLNGIAAALLGDLRNKLTQPLLNLFILDLFEEEFPQFTSASPNYNSLNSNVMMKRSLANVQHLLPIDIGYVKEVPMEYRVQSSGLVTLVPSNSPQLTSSNSSGNIGSSSSSTGNAVVTPTNEVERLRKSIQVLLLLRNFQLKNLHHRDTLFYPLVALDSLPKPVSTASKEQPVQTQLFHQSPLKVSQEILTAHHPDAMLCTLQAEAKKKIHLFFVMDEFDMILVELQQNKPGTAIIQLRQPLRHQEAFLNRNNACLLHVTVRATQRPHIAARKLTYSNDMFFKPLWVISLLFLDAIQCARAWKHLDARRLALRKNMMGKLCNELNVELEEEQLHSIAAACTSIQAYPGIETDVHQDATLFGIPVLPIPSVSPAVPAVSPPAGVAATMTNPSPAAPPASATLSVPVAAPASASSVPLPMILPAPIPVAQPINAPVVMPDASIVAPVPAQIVALDLLPAASAPPAQ